MSPGWQQWNWGSCCCRLLAQPNIWIESRYLSHALTLVNWSPSRETHTCWTRGSTEDDTWPSHSKSCAQVTPRAILWVCVCGGVGESNKLACAIICSTRASSRIPGREVVVVWGREGLNLDVTCVMFSGYLPGPNSPTLQTYQSDSRCEQECRSG